MKRRKSTVIVEEMEALRAEINELAAMDEPTDEQVERSDAALAEYETMEAERAAAVEYERRIEAIRAASLESVNLEAGDGAGRGDQDATRSGAGRRGPEIMRKVDPYADPELVRSGSLGAADMISRARKAVEIAPEHMTDEQREHVDGRLTGGLKRQQPHIARHLLMTGSDSYHEAFEEFMSTGYAGQELRRAMSLTDTQGGFLVPFTLDPTIILTSDGIVDPMRDLATVRTIATDKWHGITSAGVTANWTAEGAEVDDNSPEFDQPEIPVHRADAYVEGTYEVLADSGFASELGRLLAEAKQVHEGVAFAVGNSGATRPRGVVAAVAAVAGSLVGSAADGALAAADVHRLVEEIPDRHATRAKFLANKAIYSKIRQLDQNGGSSFWANMGVGRPSQLIGADAREASAMTKTVAAGANVLLLGDFAQYYIVDRIGMSVAYEPLVKGANQRPTGKAGWFAFWRVGGDCVNPNAFRLLQLRTAPQATPLA